MDGSEIDTINFDPAFQYTNTTYDSSDLDTHTVTNVRWILWKLCRVSQKASVLVQPIKKKCLIRPQNNNKLL